MSGDAQSLPSDSHDESGVFADSIDLIPRIERSEVIRPHDRYIIDEPDAAAVTAVQSGIKPQIPCVSGCERNEMRLAGDQDGTTVLALSSTAVRIRPPRDESGAISKVAAGFISRELTDKSA